MKSTANSPAESYEVWFLTGSQDLYGPETLEAVAKDSAKIAAALDQKLPARVIPKDTLKNTEDITRTLKAAGADERCVGLIIWMHTFSPAKMWITGLDSLTKPFCQLHTQLNAEIPWDRIDMDFMNLHQTAHGGREFGFAGSRLRLERKVVAGHWQDTDVISRLDSWVRAASAFAAGQSLKIARFGDNMREVAVTEGDKVEAQRVFGYAVHGYGLGDLAKYTEAVSDADMNTLVAEYHDLYTIGSHLQSHPKPLKDAAKIEIAMRRFLKDGGFGAFTTTFENLSGLCQLPGLACQRLMADGYGFGAEGDWKTAALLYAVKIMGAGLPGGTSFMEDYTYHMVPGRSQVLGAHMLEVCPSVAKDPVRLEVHPLGIGGKDDPARLVFESPSGPAVNVSLMDMGSRFRMVLNEVTSVDPPSRLPKLPVARVLWEPEPDLATAAASWIYAGGAHHTVYSQAVNREHICDYASMAGTELICIGRDSTVDGIRKELRWNDLYYHLAKGI